MHFFIAPIIPFFLLASGVLLLIPQRGVNFRNSVLVFLGGFLGVCLVLFTLHFISISKLTMMGAGGLFAFYAVLMTVVLITIYGSQGEAFATAQGYLFQNFFVFLPCYILAQVLSCLVACAAYLLMGKLDTFSIFTHVIGINAFITTFLLLFFFSSIKDPELKQVKLLAVSFCMIAFIILVFLFGPYSLSYIFPLMTYNVLLPYFMIMFVTVYESRFGW